MTAIVLKLLVDRKVFDAPSRICTALGSVLVSNMTVKVPESLPGTVIANRPWSLLAPV